ncbi:MAG: DUF2007 domain-containing protein [Oligoflexales bacterium]|nr:DUF2007 domain-containing protein [Oligoflexales bacterium]
MKIVATCNNRIEAEIIRAKLESFGIPASISADDEGGLHPGLALTQGVHVYVADDVEEEAKAILTKETDD